ncbi:hypothetical protein ACLI4Z_07085 [Natrialbaceae archaeon A-arb3/5]
MMTASINVNLWHTPDVTDTSIDLATDAIEELADELDTNWVHAHHGEYTGDTPHDTYAEYLNEFEDEVNHYNGEHSLLLYVRSFTDDGGDTSSWPNLGGSRSMYVYNDPCYSIANANIRQTSLSSAGNFFGIAGSIITQSRLNQIYKNMVKHELLHSMLDEDPPHSDIPDEGEDHSYGGIVSPGLENRATPMVTGYVEPELSNEAPDEICTGDPDSVWDSVSNWEGTPSSCTQAEGQRWLSEEYI